MCTYIYICTYYIYYKCNCTKLTTSTYLRDVLRCPGGRLARGRLRCSLLCAPVVAVTGPRDGTDARGVLRAAAAAGDGEDVSAAGLAGPLVMDPVLRVYCRKCQRNKYRKSFKKPWGYNMRWGMTV